MKFNRDNWEDIKKYFDKSYMKFPLLGDEVVYVESVSASGMTGKRMQNADWDGWQFTFGGPDTTVDVEFVLPRKSFFESNGGVYLLTRLPAKQYKRGMCRENTSIENLTLEGFHGVSIGLELINAYTHKPSFQGFRDEVGNGYVVSRRMAVDGSGKIYVDHTKIGVVNLATRTINCSTELFIPEIEQIVREHHQQFTVVCDKVSRQQQRREAILRAKKAAAAQPADVWLEPVPAPVDEYAMIEEAEGEF